MVRVIPAFSSFSRHVFWIRSAASLFLWVTALAFWTEVSQLEVCALDAPTANSAIPDSVSSPSPNSPNEKASILRGEVRNILSTPAQAPDIVAGCVAVPVVEPNVFAGQVVCTAIQTLRQPLTAAQISALIEAAVKARPAAVLAVVRAAAQCAPQNLCRDIVTSAVAGLPDPYSRGAEDKTLAELILETAANSGCGDCRDALSAGINSSLQKTADGQDPVANGIWAGTSGANENEGSLAGNPAGGGFEAGGGGGGGGSIEGPLVTPSPSLSPTPVAGPIPPPPPGPNPTPTPFPPPTPFPTPDPTPFPQPTPTPLPVSP